MMESGSLVRKLEKYPAMLTLEMCCELAGAMFDEDLFHSVCFGEDRISKHVFLSALDDRTDVFLSHDWGADNNVDNHARVAMVNHALKQRGLLTWFDQEKMKGNIKHHMSSGIDHAQCVVVFITQRYISKVTGRNAEDNCLLEFDYAARRKTGARMIPVVMEEGVRNTRTWRGALGMVLGGRLYTDMAKDFSDQVYFEKCMDDLYDKIIELIRKPIKYMSSSCDFDSFRDLPPGDEGGSAYTKPLIALSVKDVSVLLDRLNLSMYKSIFRENQVDGPTLNLCECVDHMKELGVTITVKAKMLFEKVLVYQEDGVPVDLLSPLAGADRPEVAEVKDMPAETSSSSKGINLCRKSARKAVNNRYTRSVEEDFEDKTDMYAMSGSKTSFERYNDEASEYYEVESAELAEEEMWTCLKCSRDNYEDDPYCSFCATIRGRSGQRGRDRNLPMGI